MELFGIDILILATYLIGVSGVIIFSIKQFKENKSLFRESVLREEKVTASLDYLPKLASTLESINTRCDNLQKRVFINETKTQAILEHLLEGIPKEDIAMRILEKLKDPNHTNVLSDREMVSEIAALANRLLNKKK